MLNQLTNNPSSETFSIVIPAWNESNLIEGTLRTAYEAIKQQSYNGEIIVVDNNSTDDTAEKATAIGARVVFEPLNQIARARNTGAKASQSTWLVFLDADTQLNAELLQASLHSLASTTAIGGGSTVQFDQEVTGVTRWLLHFWNWWSVKFGAAAGCYLFCTAEAFAQVGGFDEKQYAAEELYLSKKLRKLARQRRQQFIIHSEYPVISSARKVDWYSTPQKIKQVLLLLIPGTTRSKALLNMWYDRSNIND